MDFNLSVGAFAQNENIEPLNQGLVYDILILGGGPAGLTAAVYCMRKGMKTAIVIRDLGGQVAETVGIENYLGYRYITGTELVDKFREQVQEFSIGFEEGPSVTAVKPGDVKEVRLDDGRVLKAKALIVTTGKASRKLNVPGEEELIGHGVAYCAICDAPLYAGKKTIVVGGGNSGLEAAIDLAKVSTHVTLVQSREYLKADRVLIDKLNEFTNVDIIYEHKIVEIKGKDTVEEVIVRDRKSGDTRTVAAEGIFVEIGLLPNTGFAEGVLELNEAGEIVIDCACRTSQAGIFAAGDVTSVPYKQIIIAAGEGATAALSACDYVMKH